MRVSYPVESVRFQSKIVFNKILNPHFQGQEPCSDNELTIYKSLQQLFQFCRFGKTHYVLPDFSQCPPPVQNALETALSCEVLNLENFRNQILDNQFGVLEKGSDVAFFFLLQWGVQRAFAHAPLLSWVKRLVLQAHFPENPEPKDLEALLARAQALIPDLACHQLLAKLPGQSDKTAEQLADTLKELKLLYAWILIESVVHQRVLNRDNFNLGTIQKNLHKEQQEWEEYTQEPGELQQQGNDTLRLQYVLTESNRLLKARSSKKSSSKKSLTIDDFIRFQQWKVAGRTASLMLNPEQTYDKMKQTAKAWEKLFESALLAGAPVLSSEHS